MRLLFEFLPLASFFVMYKFHGLMAATWLLMVLTIICLAVIYLKEKRIAVAPLLSTLLIALFGGLALWFGNDTFIKMKPTLVNLFFAFILFLGLFFRRGLLQNLLGSALPMHPEGWILLSRRWAFFFLGLAALNEYVWRHYSTDLWVDFKFFGVMTLTLLFTAFQIPLIQRFRFDREGESLENFDWSNEDA